MMTRCSRSLGRAIAPKGGSLATVLKGGAATLVTLTLTAQPGWTIPGQTVSLTESWIRNHPTLNPAPHERLTINRIVVPGQRFIFQASVFPITGVSPGDNRRLIRTEQFSLVDSANPITPNRLDESLRAIYGQDIFNDYREGVVRLSYPARGSRPAPTDNPNLVRRGEVRQGEQFAYWQEIAYDRTGTAYLGRMAVFLKEDLPALEAQLAP